MEAFLISIGVVLLGEMGDKTQLLAFVLAARFKQPVVILLGVLAATLVNHTAAGALGAWIAAQVGPQLLRWIVGIGFLAMAAWTLKQDKLDAHLDGIAQRFGVFGTTVITFFMAEMGDKTQLATVALAARFHTLLPVVAGTTLGMLIADAPVIFLGGAIARRIPLRLVHGIAALIFAVLGVLALLDVGEAG